MTGTAGTGGIASVIEEHLDALRQPGVLSIRPGYKVTKGWLTGGPAIVATVAAKTATPPAGEVLPDETVDEAVPRDRLERTRELGHGWRRYAKRGTRRSGLAIAKRRASIIFGASLRHARKAPGAAAARAGAV
jgi:hypothetical protein